MANFIQQLNISDQTYDLYDSEFIVDTRSASGAALTGVSKASALFDGMQITFWMNYAAASNATLNLTLANGTTTGAVPCYYSGTTRMGTQYAAGNVIRFTYRENVTIGSTTVTEGWWADANYTVSDTNYDIFGTSIPIKTRLNAYCLCAMVGTEGTIAKQTNTVGAGTYWQINAFTQTSGTGATKKLIANQGYYPGKLFYFTGSSAITDAGSVSGTISASTNNMDLRYTVNGSSSANIGVTGAPFFLVGSLGSDGLFYPNGHASEATKEWWQCGFPTDLTSTYVYWFVGMMTSKYQCRLSDHNWMLKSDGTKWIVFDGAKKVSWDNIEGKPAIPDLPSAPNNDGDYSLNVSNGTTSWAAVDDHILVMTGTPTGALDSAPINTTTTWTEYYTAVTNHDRLILEIPYASSRLEFQAESDNGRLVNVLYHYGANPRAIYNAVYNALTDDNGYVYFVRDTTGKMFADYATQAGEAESVPWSGITSNPYPIDAPSTNGNYSLNVSNGATSWTAASGGPNTPDAPATDGNYILNVSDGGSNWSSVIYTINIERHSGESTWTLLNDSDEAYSEVEAYVIGDGSTRRPIQFRTVEDGGDIVSVYTGFFPFNFFPVVGGYFYKVTPTLQYSSPYLINPLIHDGWMIAWSMVDPSSPLLLQSFSRNIVTSDLLSSSSVLSSASLSGGTTPTITYSAATASKAALTNGLLSFGDVSASNITNWSAGSMPTISTNTITVVTPASS